MGRSGFSSALEGCRAAHTADDLPEHADSVTHARHARTCSLSLIPVGNPWPEGTDLLPLCL